MTATGRVYAGKTEPERRQERRGRLLVAGLELFGTEGWAGTSIERLCAEANVATRYFYELFTDRDALLLALYLELQREATEAVIKALIGVSGELPDLARAGLSAYVGYHAEDPRRARVVHREARAVGSLQGVRRSAMLTFADLIEHAVRNQLTSRDPRRQRVVAVALAGGVSEVLVDWVAHEEPRPPVELIVDELTLLYLGALSPESLR